MAPFLFGRWAGFGVPYQGFGRLAVHVVQCDGILQYRIISAYLAMIFYLLYWGVESRKMDDAEMELLLEQARGRNQSLGITGSLFYCEGTYIQLLEGPEDAVRQVYASIAKDVRLAACKLVMHGNVRQRYFADWGMHYQQVDQESIARLEGYPVEDVRSFLKKTPAIKLLKLLTRRITDGK